MTQKLRNIDMNQVRTLLFEKTVDDVAFLGAFKQYREPVFGLALNSVDFVGGGGGEVRYVDVNHVPTRTVSRRPDLIQSMTQQIAFED